MQVSRVEIARELEAVPVQNDAGAVPKDHFSCEPAAARTRPSVGDDQAES